jgi:hypothetical protein
MDLEQVGVDREVPAVEGAVELVVVEIESVMPEADKAVSGQQKLEELAQVHLALDKW